MRLNVTLVLLFFFVKSFYAYAQKPLTALKLGSYQSLSDVSWQDSIYLLPQFQRATLTYNNGFQVEGSWLMNYNRYFESMDMISDTGDTLSVKRTPELKFVNLPGKTFYHDYSLGYLEVLTKTPVALGVKHIMYTVNHKSGFDLRGYTYPYDRYYVNGPMYFFFGHNNSLFRANQNSILKLYPAHKEAIKEYLKAEPINFYRENDLMRLLTFCTRFDMQFEKSESPEYFRIPANEHIATVPWRKEIYAYPEFSSAHITLRDKKSLQFDRKVNYNYFSGSMEYLDKKGDTLEIKPSANIRIINLDRDVYCFISGRGYVKLLFQSKVSLGVKNQMTLVRKELLAEDPVDEPYTESSQVAYGKDNVKVPVKYDRLYTKTATYFFINNQYNAFPASQQTMFLMFPGNKKEIEAYLNENKPDFKSQEDLIKLIIFCNQLHRN